MEYYYMSGYYSMSSYYYEPFVLFPNLHPADRIMVIDCGGTCGVSGPTDKVAGYGSIGMWNELGPVDWFVDPPWEDSENEVVDELIVTTPMPTPMGFSYEITYDSSYYAGFNVDISGVMVAVDGTSRPLKSFQCYEMCGISDCEGEWCKCDGYLSGIDGPDSNALCADESTCQYLCDQVDCQAIDMAKDVPRCFLNSLPKDADGAIDAQAALDALMPDARYRIISQVPPNEDFGSDRRQLKDRDPRELQSYSYSYSESYSGYSGYSYSGYYYGMDYMAYYMATLGPGAPGSALLEREDLGYSWPEMLRFTGLTFTTGGTFKLCFCDSALIGGVATPCLTKKDYAIEIGKVHSSGVSCLLSQPKLQRAACVEMFHGGMRCYSGIPVPEVTPPLLMSTQVGIDAEVEGGSYAAPVGSSQGAYSPEEDDDFQPAPQSGNAAPPPPPRRA
jgi:hypothetical protein